MLSIQMIKNWNVKKWKVSTSSWFDETSNVNIYSGDLADLFVFFSAVSIVKINLSKQDTLKQNSFYHSIIYT